MRGHAIHEIARLHTQYPGERSLVEERAHDLAQTIIGYTTDPVSRIPGLDLPTHEVEWGGAEGTTYTGEGTSFDSNATALQWDFPLLDVEKLVSNEEIDSIFNGQNNDKIFPSQGEHEATVAQSSSWNDQSFYSQLWAIDPSVLSNILESEATIVNRQSNERPKPKKILPVTEKPEWMGQSQVRAPDPLIPPSKRTKRGLSGDATNPHGQKRRKYRQSPSDTISPTSGVPVSLQEQISVYFHGTMPGGFEEVYYDLASRIDQKYHVEVPFLTQMFFAIGNHEAFGQLRRILHCVRSSDGGLILASKPSIADTITSTDYESLADARMLFRRFYLMDLSDLHLDLVTQYEKSRGTFSGKPTTKALDHLVEQSYSSGSGASRTPKNPKKQIQNRLHFSQNWGAFAERFSRGLIALIPRGGHFQFWDQRSVRDPFCEVPLT